jgi:anthranilate phosphoribosyltransferase
VSARAALQTLLAGRTLDTDATAALFEEVLAGAVPPAQLGALLVALRLQGETADELVGAARVLRAHAVPVPGVTPEAVDTCGTGGDGAGTFNVSTAAALVVAGAGVPVAKHGNRAVSGVTGSTDVLEALGVVVDLPPARLAACVRDVGIVFLHAPALHPALAQVAPTRRELGVRTIFNLLGPLVNPAGVRRQVVGVPEPRWVEPMAVALARLGAEHAWVVCGEGGLDELALAGPSRVARVRNGAIDTIEVRPSELGLAPAPLATLTVCSVAESAERIRGVLAGVPGPARDIVALNAAAALVVAGVSADLRAGLARAAASIDEGHARRTLEGLRSFTSAAAENRP